jgi:hypothetical protein
LHRLLLILNLRGFGPAPLKATNQMKSLSKYDEERRAKISAHLQEQAQEVEKAHAELTEAIETYNAVIASYNEVVTEATGFAEDMASAIGAYIDEKSEKWQDSDRGQAFTDWQDEFQNADFEEIDTVEVPNLPEFTNEATLDDLPGFPND